MLGFIGFTGTLVYQLRPWEQWMNVKVKVQIQGPGVGYLGQSSSPVVRET